MAEKVSIVSAPMGTGKTTCLANNVKRAKSALIVNHRISLSRSAAATYGAACYLDLPDGAIFPSEHGSKIVTTINSLSRVQRYTRDADPIDDTPTGFDLLIVEESESTLSQLYGGTIGRTGEHGKPAGGDIWAHFLDLCRDTVAAGGRVVFVDAHAGNVTAKAAELVAAHASIPNTPHIVTMPESLDWTAHFYGAKTAIVGQILQDAAEGKRLYIACTHKGTVAALVQLTRGMVTTDGTPVTVLAHHREQDDSAMAALANPERSWAKNQIVLASPTVDAGVSYASGVPFDRRYVIAEAVRTQQTQAFGVKKILQMSRRVRDCAVNDPDIHFYVAKNFRHDASCSPQAVSADLLGKAAITRYALKFDPQAGAIVLKPQDASHLSLAIVVGVDQRWDSREVEADLQVALGWGGVRCVDATPTAPAIAPKVWTAAVKAAKVEEASKRYAAPPLRQGAYLDLKSKGAECEADRLSLQRSGALDAFGAASFETLLADLGGKRRKQVAAFVEVKLVALGETQRVTEYDVACAKAGYTASMPGAWAARGALEKCLRVVLDPSDFDRLLGLNQGPVTPKIAKILDFPESGNSQSEQVVLAAVTPPILDSKMIPGVTGNTPLDLPQLAANLAGLSAAIKEQSRKLGVLFPAPGKPSVSPAQLVASVLSAVGLSTDCTRREVKGATVRSYSVAGIDDLLADSARMFDFAMGIQPVAIDRIDPVIIAEDAIFNEELEAAQAETLEMLNEYLSCKPVTIPGVPPEDVEESEEEFDPADYL